MRGMFVLYGVGALLRLYLMNSRTIGDTIRARVELSTPLNSWLRVQEGVFLQSQGVDVYSGGVFHETPLTLFLAGFLIRSPRWWLQLVFVMLDLLTAYILSCVASSYARKLLQQQREQVSKYASDSCHLLLKASTLSQSVRDVAAAYLLCPYTVLSCAALTTTTLHNTVLAAALLAMLKGRALVFGALVALATYQAVYPVVILVPGLIALHQHHSGAKGASEEGVTVVLKSLLSFGAAGALLLLVSAEFAGGWDFLEATYGFILSAPDLTPNIGLFWYFFTEMFEHFRLFFLAVFQLNALVYVAPLCVRLRGDPVLLSTALLALSAVFRSYPSLGDVGFYLALLPTCRHLYPFLRQSFLVGCMLVASSVLGPIMYNLWIYSGAANANFYFAVTLAFNTAQIFLVTDLLFGHVKRQHLLYNGSSMTVDGQPARLTLE